MNNTYNTSEGKSSTKMSTTTPIAAIPIPLPTATACSASIAGLFSAFCSSGISVGTILTSAWKHDTLLKRTFFSYSQYFYQRELSLSIKVGLTLPFRNSVFTYLGIFLSRSTTLVEPVGTVHSCICRRLARYHSFHMSEICRIYPTGYHMWYRILSSLTMSPQPLQRRTRVNRNVTNHVIVIDLPTRNSHKIISTEAISYYRLLTTSNFGFL